MQVARTPLIKSNHNSVGILLHFILFTQLIGCQKSGSTPEVEKKPNDSVIEIKRLRNAEIVLAKLGHKAWVFEHRGGVITTEFTVFHRPQGRNQKSTVIYQRTGDDAVRIHQARTDESDSRKELRGHVIVGIPTNLLAGKADGEFTHHLSLNNAAVLHRASANKIVPPTVFSHTGTFESGFSQSDGPHHFKPGDSRVVVDESIRLVNDVPTNSPDERETIRIVLQVTALSERKTPDRENSVNK